MTQSREEMFREMTKSFEKPTQEQATALLNQVSQNQEAMLQRIYASVPSAKDSRKVYNL